MGCFYSLSKWGDTAAYFVQRVSLRNFGPRFVLVDWGDILTFRIMNRSGDSLIMLWPCLHRGLSYLLGLLLAFWLSCLLGLLSAFWPVASL